MQGFWRLTGRGSDRDEQEVTERQQRKGVGRAGRFVLRLLGYRGRFRRPGKP